MEKCDKCGERKERTLTGAFGFDTLCAGCYGKRILALRQQNTPRETKQKSLKRWPEK